MGRRSVLLLAVVALATVGCAPAAAQVEREVIGSSAPRFPLSAVVRAGDTYYFSGKLGMSAEVREAQGRGESTAAAETRNIMEAFEAQFAELGLDLSDSAVKATVFFTNPDDYGPINEVYGSYFGDDPPAREAVIVQGLVAGATVEISFIAVRSGGM